MLADVIFPILQSGLLYKSSTVTETSDISLDTNFSATWQVVGIFLHAIRK